MSERILDRLLVTLDVAVEAFAICEIRRGLRLITRPKNAIEVHYVLAGTMHLLTPAAEPIVCGPGSLVLIPPRMPQTIAADDMPARNVMAVETCSIVQANTTAVVVKSSAGTLGGLQYYNISSAPLWVKFYKAGSGITCGTGTVVKRIMIPSASTAANGAGNNVSFGNGVTFSSGITMCITAGIADNDTTAPTANTATVGVDYEQ